MHSNTNAFARTRVLAITAAIALLSSACSLIGPKVETKEYETDDGAIIVETLKLTATVKAVDGRNRTLTLDPKYGDEQTVTVPPEMVNVDQISVGDVVQAEIIEEIAVSLVPGGAAESAGALEGIALAPVGSTPAIAVVSSRELTADVVAIDFEKKQE